MAPKNFNLLRAALAAETSKIFSKAIRMPELVKTEVNLVDDPDYPDKEVSIVTSRVIMHATDKTPPLSR